MRLGYARVSRPDQHTEQQEVALKDAGCERIYVDHGVSGTAKHQPELDRLLDHLRPGDVVVVSKLDRMGRTLQGLLEVVTLIEKRGAGLVSLAESEIDTTSAAGKMIFRFFAIFAEFERDRIRERTIEGIERARSQGAHMGRPRRLNESDIKNLRTLRQQGRSYSNLAKTFKIARSTARKYCLES